MNPLQIAALCVLCVDVATLAGALGVSYYLIRYRREIAFFVAWLKWTHEEME